MVGIVDFGSKKTPEITAVLNKLVCENAVLPWDEWDESKLKKFDSIILSGAPVLLTEVDYQKYIAKFIFLKDSCIPVLGICFGHQLLGLMHGSEVFKGEVVREWIEIEILEKDALFKGIKHKSMLMEDHTEGITLPKNFICLAKSNKYEVEAMKHNSKHMYGVQFHPEVSGINGEKLLRNFMTS